ncbi:NAD(P)-dependent oxidoreductase [Rhodococcus sp. NPDC057014]|uniref:NAD(P)-dependent oxidoreductase n=1 Tax=Rhodococcus sp. NPDC057014 TaxID=3346000 RepID=UPI0036350DEC
MDDRYQEDDELMTETPTVAFLGLGRMGLPMAANVADAGFPVVVYNRTRSVAEEFAQRDGVTASVADSPRAAAEAADVVVTMLADEPALRAVYEGDNGLIAGWSDGKIALDMGTTGPAGTAWLADVIGRAGGDVVDAPVSGSTNAAQTRTLTLMAGGSDQALKTVRPVLEAMGSNIYHLGATGTGSAMKLAVNNVIYALGQAVSESLILAERAGIERELAYDVFCNSAIAAPMVKYRQRNYVEPDDSPVTFALRLAAKDLRLITGLAAEVGAPMPQAALNLQETDEAIAAGFGEEDMAAVAVYLRNAAAANGQQEARA